MVPCRGPRPCQDVLPDAIKVIISEIGDGDGMDASTLFRPYLAKILDKLIEKMSDCIHNELVQIINLWVPADLLPLEHRLNLPCELSSRTSMLCAVESHDILSCSYSTE
jgi:hypothetical protein